MRDIYVCGDIFLRVPEWGNDRLQERLSSLGLRVTFEPFAAFFEFLALRGNPGPRGAHRGVVEVSRLLAGYEAHRALAAPGRDPNYILGCGVV